MGILVFGLSGCSKNDAINENLRIVIGSKSIGGDTYQNSTIIARALAEKLGINVKIDAIGSSDSLKTLSRVSDGSVIMIFHDQAYLGYLYGVNGYRDIFKDFSVGPAIAKNPGNAYLVPKGSPYRTLEDLMTACGEGSRIRVAIQPGGVSEIGFSALKNAIRILYPGQEKNLVAVNTGSSSAKNQLLFDGQVDVIHGSVQGNEQYTRLPAEDQKAMRFIWLTARNETFARTNPEGIGTTTREELLSFVEPNASVPLEGGGNFTFDKEYFFIYNKRMSPTIVAQLDQALSEIFEEGKVQETQLQSFFIPNFMASTEAKIYFEAKRDQNESIIKSLENENAAPGEGMIDFSQSHLFFPRIIQGILLGLGVLIGVRALLSLMRSPKTDKTAYAFFQKNYDKLRFYGTLSLTVIYFLAMDFVGSFFPNRGLGFLLMSTPFMLSLSFLYARDLNQKKTIEIVINSLIMPGIVWFLLTTVFNVTLP